jgi:hypothetical protein
VRKLARRLPKAKPIAPNPIEPSREPFPPGPRPIDPEEQRPVGPSGPGPLDVGPSFR